MQYEEAEADTRYQLRMSLFQGTSIGEVGKT